MLNFWLKFVHNIETISAWCNQKWYLWKWQFQKSNARHQGLTSFFSSYLVISIKFLSRRDIIKIYREKFSSRLLHQLVEMEMEKYGYSFLSSIGLEGDMKCANVYFCCLGFIYTWIFGEFRKQKKLDSKKMSVWFPSNWQWDWHFVAVSENAWTQNCRCHKYSQKYQNTKKHVGICQIDFQAKKHKTKILILKDLAVFYRYFCRHCWRGKIQK